jgi:hypothetical protein
VKAYAIAAALLALATPADAKVLEGQNLPPGWNKLRNADSFSVECRNVHTGVIDRETVDVDAATVTVEIPGAAPVVHRIISFAIDPKPVVDQFGQYAGWDMPLIAADWARDGDTMVGLLLVGSANGPRRWSSAHEDRSVWFCANPEPAMLGASPDAAPPPPEPAPPPAPTAVPATGEAIPSNFPRGLLTMDQALRLGATAPRSSVPAACVNIASKSFPSIAALRRAHALCDRR